MYNTENQKIINVDIEKEMKKSYLDYSMSVIVGRALPDVRDGLKPVHRRILYTLYENGLTPEKAYRKCADTVGSVLGRYHPHGDASVYDALVRLAQDFSLRYPLVDGHGNFGSIDGDPPAAYRYTEAKMSKISVDMLTDIDKETVPFVPNYDDRLQEPSVMPSRFPNLLVNGSSGIAVGMATNIPPHNLKEVTDGICYLIDNPDADLPDLMEFIKGPDFPTGGIIMGRAGIRAAYATGRGKILLRAKTDIEEEKNGKFKIIVNEIPYMVNKARLIQSIAELVKQKRIEGITDLRDESDRDGMRIVIELRRDANPQIILNQLYSYTQMQETVGVIMLAICNGVPRVLNLKQILEQYITFQEQVITRRTQFDLRKAQERAHILDGLMIALDFIDEVIAILRAAKSITEGKEGLMTRFDLSEVQATAIVQMRLGQLTGLERQKIEEELAALQTKIAELEAILGDENLVRSIIKDELSAIAKKYNDERRTKIENISGEMDIEDLIPVEDCVVTLTHFGYIKRLPADSYKTQRRGGRGISGMTRRDEDFVEEMFISSSHDHVLYITNKGRMYRMKCYEIPEGSRISRGTNIVNLLPLEADEKVASIMHVSAFDEDKFLVMVTKNGIIKRTGLGAYKNVRKKGLIAINLRENDELCSVRLTNGENNLILATRMGMSIRINENTIRPLSRGASGVRGIRLREGDQVVGMARIREGATLLTITDLGYGRRSDLSEYRTQARGGLGLKNYKVSEVKGEVCGIKVVDETDDIILISNEGIIIRIRVVDINIMSRYAGGVRVMRLSEEGRVVAFARAEHDEEEEVAEVEKPSDEEIEKEIEEGKKEEESIIQEDSEADLEDEEELEDSDQELDE